MNHLIMSLFLSLSFSQFVMADVPLSPPSTKTVCSANGMVCANTHPQNGVSVFTKEQESEKLFWIMPGWYRVMFVADDGDHVVTGYDGQNLLSRRDPAEIMLRFWKRGTLIRAVPLKELLSDLESLERTVSHWHWGNYLGIDGDGHMSVKTVDGHLHRYDITTGRSVH